MLETADWVAVGFDLGMLDVVARDDEDSVVGYLGPDVLGADWDPALAVANIEREPDREIGLALLDQRNLAGLGNIYRTEVLFLRGVLPTRPVREVADLPRMVELAHRLMDVNKDRVDRTTTGNLRGNTDWVYGRDGPAVPALRHDDREGRARRERAAAAGDLLLSAMPDVSSDRETARA